MKKGGLNSIFYKAPVAEPNKSEEETQAYVESLTHELATAEIDTRFREALRKGETMGDVVMVDDQGIPVKDRPKRKLLLGK